MPARTEIHIRDPFVLPVPAERRYYLYGTNCSNGLTRPTLGFDCYSSADLELWDGPFPAFRATAGFWADRNFWAPEVHSYHGCYYMLASFKAPGVCRGTQILVSPTPCGPFNPISEGPVTPPEWECLDGTLWIEDGQPWLVFCHEWVQTVDGEICALPLSADLTRPAGKPALLFRASEAPWVRTLTADWEGQKRTGYVTDGPFLYQSGSELRLLWSSYGCQGYVLAEARSSSGCLAGPWQHQPQPLHNQDGGHAMIFQDFEGGPANGPAPTQQLAPRTPTFPAFSLPMIYTRELVIAKLKKYLPGPPGC